MRCAFVGGGFYEGVCHHDWRSLRPAGSRAYLACYRGRIASGEVAFVHSHHTCSRSFIRVGDEVAPALTSTVTDVDYRCSVRFNFPQSQAYGRQDECGRGSVTCVKAMLRQLCGKSHNCASLASDVVPSAVWHDELDCPRKHRALQTRTRTCIRWRSDIFCRADGAR
jgi:hypothetical protein